MICFRCYFSFFFLFHILYFYIYIQRKRDKRFKLIVWFFVGKFLCLPVNQCFSAPAAAFFTARSRAVRAVRTVQAIRAVRSLCSSLFGLSEARCPETINTKIHRLCTSTISNPLDNKRCMRKMSCVDFLSRVMAHSVSSRLFFF